MCIVCKCFGLILCLTYKIRNGCQTVGCCFLLRLCLAAVCSSAAAGSKQSCGTSKHYHKNDQKDCTSDQCRNGQASSGTMMLLFLSGSMLGSRSVFFLCIIVIVIVVFFFLKCGDLRFCDLLRCMFDLTKLLF